jgi:hypothetical protein
MASRNGRHCRLRFGMGEGMLEPEDVARMVALHEMGWGAKRIVRELGVERNTVERHLAAGGYVPYWVVRCPGKLGGLEKWLEQRFQQHWGNCDVLRQELAREHGIAVSLRTVERACWGFRAGLAARARAALRFETPPGRQLQIDFGETVFLIGGEKTKVHVFVATFRHQRQSAWFAGLEGAFAHFGGIPRRQKKNTVIERAPQGAAAAPGLRRLPRAAHAAPRGKNCGKNEGRGRLIKTESIQTIIHEFWRKGWDSNPRHPRECA